MPAFQDNCKVPYDNEIIKAPPAISEIGKIQNVGILLAALTSSPQHQPQPPSQESRHTKPRGKRSTPEVGDAYYLGKTISVKVTLNKPVTGKPGVDSEYG